MVHNKLLQALIKQLDLVVNKGSSFESAAEETSKEFDVDLSSFDIKIGESLDLLKLYIKVTHNIALDKAGDTQ